jgi:hypothetical protein
LPPIASAAALTKNYGERLLTHIGRLFHDWHRRADRSVAAADNRLARRRAELLAAAKRPLLARKPKTSPTAFGATPTIIFDS